MPYSPNRPCSQPNCRAYQAPGSRYCALHKRATDAAYDKARGTSTERGYDATWQRIRASYLMDHPQCADCGEPANEVHHIAPLAQGGTHEASNLMALCKGCHSKRTDRFRNREVQLAEGREESRATEVVWMMEDNKGHGWTIKSLAMPPAQPVRKLCVRDRNRP